MDEARAPLEGRPAYQQNQVVIETGAARIAGSRCHASRARPAWARAFAVSQTAARDSGHASIAGAPRVIPALQQREDLVQQRYERVDL